MSLYTELAATAEELLAEFGQPVVLSRKVGSTYNAATGQATVTEVAQAGFAVILDVSINDVDNTLVHVGDKRMYLSAVGVSPPNADDTVTLANGQQFNIHYTKALSPAGTPVIYECNIRA